MPSGFGTVTANYDIMIGGLLIGGYIGVTLARKVEMTEMPELVAILHSLVGIAAAWGIRRYNVWFVARQEKPGPASEPIGGGETIGEGQSPATD